MCTSYGASWGSKNEYISTEIEEAFKLDPYNPSLTDKRLVTDACIEGQSSAFPQCDILNKWFKDFGKACMDAGKEMVEWHTPNGSFIRQEYREPVCKQVKTHAMGGGSYYQIRRIDDPAKKGNVTQYSVQTGYGEVKENKSATALGANWTHSLDACLLQDTIADWDQPFFTVHDCFYGLAGDMVEFGKQARIAFKKVVEDDPMHTLIKDNELDIPLPPFGTADLSDCLNAPYMFS
jgi:DNA-directed RNA polymerase